MIDTARRRLLACAVIAGALPARAACAARSPVIGYVPGGGAAFDPAADAIRAAAAHDGISVKFAATAQHAHRQAGPQISQQIGPQASQVAAIRSFITEKVSLIVLAPVADSGWETVLREAKAAAIPVIVTGRALAAGEQDLVATFIGPDPAAQGRHAGRWLAAHTAQATRMPGAPFNIVELQGAQDSPQTLAHHHGFTQAIAGHSRLRMLQSRAAGPSRAGAMAVMAELLRAGGGNIGAVYAHSGELAIGAMAAIEQAGMRPGHDILVLSAGGGADAANAMAAGKINVAIACQPLSAAQLMQVARDVMAGKRVPRWVPPAE
jgi:simple sugar transport system substrate-binding protein